MELISLDVRAGAPHESQSGMQMLRPRIWGAFRRSVTTRVAAIVVHPTSNFMGHYLLQPLAERGVAVLGLNTRYLGNDTVLILEHAIQDVGAGVTWLQQQGYERVLLIGNSGGGALASLYQAQAESLDIDKTPAGDPIDLHPSDLPPVQGIVLTAAHLGRSRLMEKWIDPAVIDEADPLPSDASLDMFNLHNGPPYSPEFIQRYRAAQTARLRRLENWVNKRLSQLRTLNDVPRDLPFIVHRTLADPRCLDSSLDPNDRAPGMSVWGPPRQQNYAANSMGRVSTLTAFLSQWALSSRGDGPVNLARTSVPVLLIEHTADASTFPSDNQCWADAATGRVTRRVLKGGTHYLTGQPHLVAEMADAVTEFATQI